MAAITSALVAGAGLALNAYQTYQGVQQSEAAAKSASDIGAQQKMLAEQNRVAGVQVPQLGYQLAQQSGAQRTANQVQALQGAGAAAVLGGLPGVGQQGTNQDLQLAAQLDQAKYERDTFVAQQEQAMQARKIAQQNDFLTSQLQGAQMARAQGQANVNAGLTGAAGTLGALAVQYDKTRSLYDKQKEEAPNKLGAPQPVSNPERLLNQYPAVDLPQPKINAKYWENAQYNPLAQFQINPNIGQSVSPYQMNPNIGKSVSPFQSFTNPVDNF
jgi:hypothetical protein